MYRIYTFGNWNPATKLSKRISLHNISNEGTQSVVFGFGFDPIGNDFKVVRVVSPFFFLLRFILLVEMIGVKLRLILLIFL